MARLSSSRYPLYCGLWVPGGRTEPFFPLCPCRSIGLTHPRSAAAVPPSGFARSVSSGIILSRSPPYAKPLLAFSCGSCPAVLFVELHFNNTVVLTNHQNSTLRKPRTVGIRRTNILVIQRLFAV